MAYDVTSWYVDQLNSASSEPKRVFTIGGSDYTDRVNKFPTIKRGAYKLRSPDITVPLANDDGAFNQFYSNLYTGSSSCELKIGFTHPISGDELVTIFSGFLKKVSYRGEACTLSFKDKFWELSERKIADSDDPTSFSNVTPSEIAWTLCTCYGRLSNVQNTSNPDLDYASFQDWTRIFSRDSVLCTARYEGEKVTEALISIAQMTDSAIWTEGDGKIKFERFESASTNDKTLTEDHIIELETNLEDARLINKQYVYGNYDIIDDWWLLKIFDISSSSVDSYSLREDVIKDKTIWYVNTGSAMNIAQRRVFLSKDIPKRFNLETSLVGMYQQISDTIRIKDDFLGITSSDSWRIMEYSLNMDNGSVKYEIDGAYIMNAFVLDVDALDGAKVLV